MKRKSKINLSCPNKKCKDFGKKYTGRLKVASTYQVFGGTLKRHQYVCERCGRHFAETINTFYHRKKTSPEVINNVLEHNVRGVGIRDTAELVGISKDTVERIILNVGLHINKWYSSLNFTLPKGNIEYDEMWTFVMRKKSNDPKKGDIWLWLSFHRETRFLIYCVVAKHTAENAEELLRQTKLRIHQLSNHHSDELPCYENVFKAVYCNAFQLPAEGSQLYFQFEEQESNQLNYAQVRKTRQKSRIVDIKKSVVFGEVDKSDISTSLNERHNLNVRQDNSRTTRKSLRFSKEWVYLFASMWIYLFYYNFKRPHTSLRKENIDYATGKSLSKWIKKTPAREAMVIDKVLDWDTPLKWSPDCG